MTGDEFRETYKRLGYQAAEIAAELGVSYETIRRVQRAKRVPRIYALALSWLTVQPSFAGIVLAIKRARVQLGGEALPPKRKA